MDALSGGHMKGVAAVMHLSKRKFIDKKEQFFSLAAKGNKMEDLHVPEG